MATSSCACGCAGPVFLAVLGGEPLAAGALRTDFVPGGASTLLCGTRADRATIYCGRDSARACWDSLVALGVLPVGSTALETVRIEDAEPCLESATSRSRSPSRWRAWASSPPPTKPRAGRDRDEGPAPLARASSASAAPRWARSASAPGRWAGRAGVALATMDRALAAPGSP